MTNTEKILVAIGVFLLATLAYQMYQNSALSTKYLLEKQKDEDLIKQFDDYKKANKLFTDSLEQQIDESDAKFQAAIKDSGKVTIKYAPIHNNTRTLTPDEQVRFTGSRLPKENPYK